MNTFARCNKNKYLTRFTAVFLSLSLLLGVQGCFHNDDDPTPVTNPNGFYDEGNVTFTGGGQLTMPRVLIADNRILLSADDGVTSVVYDITINEISGNTYTGTFTVYINGDFLVTDNGLPQIVTGVINQSVSISGTISGTPNASLDGIFDVNYSLNNNVSNLTRIAKNWQGPINLEDDTVDTVISGTGQLSRVNNEGFPVNTPALNGCVIDSANSTVLPVANQSIYNAEVTLSGCTNTDADGVYTGFAATQTVADETLNLVYTKGDFSGSSILSISP